MSRREEKKTKKSKLEVTQIRYKSSLCNSLLFFYFYLESHIGR